MSALKFTQEQLSAGRERATERGCRREAVDRFAERYRQHCDFGPDGKPIGVIPRLRLALELARSGQGKQRLGRPGLFQGAGDNYPDRKIFDVELPADDLNPKPYTIRILTDAVVSVVITVLPPDFRRDMAAKKKHRELRRIVDEDIVTELGDSAEKLELPPPVQVRSSLADKLRAAMGR